jgi:hypothetical protein
MIVTGNFLVPLYQKTFGRAMQSDSAMININILNSSDSAG